MSCRRGELAHKAADEGDHTAVGAVSAATARHTFEDVRDARAGSLWSVSTSVEPFREG